MKFKDYTDQSEGNGLFITWADGENIIRIVSEYEMLWKAFDSNAVCTVFATKDAADQYNRTNPDALKDNKFRAGLKLAFYVINRATQKIQVAEVGPMIANQIRELSTKTDYSFEDIPPYDMIVTKTVLNKKVSYTVTPRIAMTPLTEEEKVQIINLDPLKKIVLKDAKDITHA